MTGKKLVGLVAFLLSASLCVPGCMAAQPQAATQAAAVEGGDSSQEAGLESGAVAGATAGTSADAPTGLESGQGSASSTTWTEIPMDRQLSGSSEAAEPKALRAKLDIVEDMREGFVHGDKPVRFQRYIVMHDTEGEGEPEGVVSYWDGADAGVAAHFVVGVDGHIVQCVPLDKIAHHAGFGDTGHNEKFGVTDESRDDKVGTEEIGEWASDYGMNSYSVGIEMVHVGGEGDYPQAQLEAVDALIAYLDAYFGKECEIIDHKMWRSGNSDTSEEFAECLENLRDHRTTRS